ncbi:MAG: hypothetical protein K9J06_09550 [Flavobacteriales bacterium]|nr:hypothetical protein [Flavobacteriales bacterium]
MKKSFLFPALFGLISLLAGSCQDNCCTLGVNKVCEGDSECAGQADWQECQTYLEGLGYTCE